MPTPLPAIILAAGASTRMRRHKALVALASGMTALYHAVTAARDGGADPVLVVTGAEGEVVGATARELGVTVVHHPGWAGGRTSSLQAALATLPDGVPGILLHPVDHPLATASTVRALRAAFEAAADDPPNSVHPVHDGRRGHPVILARRLFPAIAALDPDAPLRSVLHAADCRRLDVPVDDDGVLLNLDRPEDLARALAR